MRIFILSLIVGFATGPAFAQTLDQEERACLATDQCRLFTAPCDFSVAAKFVLEQKINARATKNNRQLKTWEDLYLDEFKMYLNQGFCAEVPQALNGQTCVYRFARNPALCKWMGM